MNVVEADEISMNHENDPAYRKDTVIIRSPASNSSLDGVFLWSGPNSNSFAFAPLNYGQNGLRLGTAYYTWRAVYANNGTIQTSDERKKDIISVLDDKYKSLFMSMKPIEFKWKDSDDDNSIHFGFGAQTTLKAIEDNNISEKLAIINSEGEYYSMSYTEALMLGVPVIQEHERKIQQLEKRVKELENLLSI